MFGSDERLIQFFLSLYPILFFPRTPFKHVFLIFCKYSCVMLPGAWLELTTNQRPRPETNTWIKYKFI